MRVLIVEDDKQTALFISKGLRQEGFAVDHAADGEYGLHIALTEPYDAAVVDIMLPGLDGLTLIDEMRRHGSEIPVIVLSLIGGHPLKGPLSRINYPVQGKTNFSSQRQNVRIFLCFMMLDLFPAPVCPCQTLLSANS